MSVGLSPLFSLALHEEKRLWKEKEEVDEGRKGVAPHGPGEGNSCHVTPETMPRPQNGLFSLSTYVELTELDVRTLEDLGDGGGVGDEGGGRGLADRGHGAEGGEGTVGDPGHEVVRVLVLEVVDRGLNVAHGELAAVRDRDGEVLAHGGVDGGKERAALEEGRGEVRDVGRGVGAVARGDEGGVAGGEEVETREGDHVDRELAEVRVEHTGETERRCCQLEYQESLAHR